MTTVLVTGAAGYIGSVTCRGLLAAGHAVVGFDNLRYGGEALLGCVGEPGFRFVRGDVRDDETVAEVLDAVDAVVHLAALVGDPACNRDPEYARGVNDLASRRLHEQCAERGVERFVFASTCSNYGKMAGDGLVDEDSDLRPISLYAETKVAVERCLLEERAGSPCRPTVLRFATAYGLSPRMRFDLTVNEFTREMALGRVLAVYGPQFWRPYCHVRDLATAVRAALEADPETVAGRVFNVGATDENYTKQMLVDLMADEIPGARVEFVERDEDPRDYRVDFRRIEQTLGFRATWKVVDGVREIRDALSCGLIEDPDGPRHTNTP